MARRRGRKGKGRGRKSIPLLPLMGAAMPLVEAYRISGFSKDLPELAFYRYTGYYKGQAWSMQVPLQVFVLPTIAGYIGHKIANKMGVNAKLKKLTGNIVL